MDILSRDTQRLLSDPNVRAAIDQLLSRQQLLVVVTTQGGQMITVRRCELGGPAKE